MSEGNGYRVGRFFVKPAPEWVVWVPVLGRRSFSSERAARRCGFKYGREVEQAQGWEAGRNLGKAWVGQRFSQLQRALAWAREQEAQELREDAAWEARVQEQRAASRRSKKGGAA